MNNRKPTPKQLGLSQEFLIFGIDTNEIVTFLSRLAENHRETPKWPKVTVRCNKAQTGIILRNCKLNKIQLLATNLAKAVTVRLKLFHVEQFSAPIL